MKRVFYGLIFAVFASSAWADASVKINVKWLYKDFASPVSIYEVKGQPALWQMKSVPSLADAPVKKLIPGSSFKILPGQSKRFVLVVKNPTDQPLYFFATPHMVHPEDDALGFKFKCLCINHSYTIGPKETWYRVVEFRLNKDFVDGELTLTHNILGIDKKRAASFPNEPVNPDL
jgi:hypothetical protein